MEPHPQALQTASLWAAILGPFVVAFLTLYITRRFKASDQAADRAAREREVQTAVLNEIKGSVADHGARLTAAETRLDGHDRELGRLYEGVFRGLNRREDPTG